MKITVYFGTGGVGKTAVSVATALAGARAGGKCLTLTTDPSLRLRLALGLKDGTLEARVALDPPAKGELWAALPDVPATLEAAVGRYAPPRDRDRILRHRVYATLGDSLSGMQELMVFERIDQLRQRGFDQIVIDTAPARHALEILDKPELFAEFAGSNWLKLLGRTYQFAEGLGMMALGRKTVDTYAKVESMLGGKLVREVLDFYALFAPVAEGYAARAGKTAAMLKDPAITEFRMVSTPQKARRDARFFTEALQKRGSRLSQVLVNRVWEREPAVREIAGTVSDALEWYRWVRTGQIAGIAGLREAFAGAVRTLPEMDGDVDSLNALEFLAERLRA